MKFDIVIVGGGMVGASLACTLQQTNLKIALIDENDLQRPDPRLIALNHNSICFFKNLGIWELLIPYAEPIKQVHISDRGHFAKLRLRAEDISLNELGFVVPAKFINQVLNQTLTNNVTCFRPCKLTKLHFTDNAIQLNVGSKEISATFAIGADGIHSTVRKELEIETDIIDYDQSALVTITSLMRSHQNIAYERFHKTGAIAMLPLQNNTCATILTDKTTTIHALMDLDDISFNHYLQNAFGSRLGKLENNHQRFIFPLKMQKAQKQFLQNVLLIGNAAHNLHPIAAQGLNLAIAEIAKLAEEILLQQNSLAHFNPENYLAWQKQQESLSTRFSHHLPAIFASDFPITKLARQFALLGLNLCPPLKRNFLSRAMGRKNRLPNLLID